MTNKNELETKVNEMMSAIDRDYQFGDLDMSEEQWQDLIILMGSIFRNSISIHENVKNIRAHGQVTGSLLKFVEFAEHLTEPNIIVQIRL